MTKEEPQPRPVTEEEKERVTRVTSYLSGSSKTPPSLKKFPEEMKERMYFMLIGTAMGMGLNDLSDYTTGDLLLAMQVFAQLDGPKEINEFIGWKGEWKGEL